MKILFLTLAAISIFAACSQTKIDEAIIKNDLSFSNPVVVETPKAISNSSDSVEENSVYQGITIGQKFPFLENHDFQEKEYDGKFYTIKADDFQVAFDDFTPKTIQDKNGKSLFEFKTLSDEGYWANVVGISNLLGENSKEIYVVASGTGGVCCTNYWITDVSKGKPRNIFRSEDYGYFRNPMEIFDADGDGIYELVQFDSAFRYFMDDCGACSPEPRAVFKYNKKLGQYVPAKHIQQDFVKKNFLETEKWIIESFEKLKKFEKNKDTENQEYRSLLLDYNSRFLEHIVDIFYLGDETKAWRIFEKYHNGYNKKDEVRAEIKKRLIESKFYQALKKTS